MGRVILKMEEKGFDEIYVDPQHVDVLQDLIKRKIDAGDPVNRRDRIPRLRSLLKPPKHP